MLGEIQTSLSGEAGVAERCALAGRKVDTQGRKHITGSALFGEDGDCPGTALGLWFEVEPDSIAHGDSVGEG